LVAESKGFRLISGSDVIRKFEAPLLKEPPVYTVYFCGTCGSHVPNPEPKGEFMDVPAGLLDDDPAIKPDKHIFIDLKANWDVITDDLPQYSGAQFRKLKLKQ